MNQHRDDKLETDLKGLGETYRERSTEEPPALIDQAVLNRAQRAVSIPARRPWSFGWVHGLTTTAIVVIGMAIYLHQPGSIPVESEPVFDLREVESPGIESRDAEPDIKPLRSPTAEQAPSPAESTANREMRKAVRQESEADKAGFSSVAPAAMELEEQRVDRAADAIMVSEPRDDEGIGNEDPEAWLERILELQRLGLEEDAREELAAFKQAWPEYPLPEDLEE